jgi:hypothetical protein
MMFADLDIQYEVVSKQIWSGLSALCRLLQLLPGASPQADIGRAFGAQIHDFT